MLRVSWVNAAHTAASSRVRSVRWLDPHNAHASVSQLFEIDTCLRVSTPSLCAILPPLPINMSQKT
ncbi:hypothetical protein FA95DRAFT_1565627 [Auriscalpium vulgare]|uniref:Uncharacterized protein n=1 Tax=Auriscalpium vulgare TaxID=40419 RepID=A0ACB8RAL1_9AGAM|nr:hypothetical protein FA95DRAFT_1565627 [Auriscalpium vulgare]